MGEEPFLHPLTEVQNLLLAHGPDFTTAPQCLFKGRAGLPETQPRGSR